jgi:hypothetical protein
MRCPTTLVRLDHDRLRRAFAYYDPGDSRYDELAASMPVPSEGSSSLRPEPGWYVEPGEYTVGVARSATNHVERLQFELTGDEVRIAP